MNNCKKVLILSCGTGGGHNSAAKALQEELLSKGIQADFSEYLDIVNPRLKDKVNNLYLKSTCKEGKIFKRVYKLGELYQKSRLKSPIYKINSLSKKRLYRYIIEEGYNYIVTTHLFAAQALTAIKKEHKIHFMEIATDYVCIPFWEETDPDCFVIPNKELEKDFIEKGIKKEKILPIGIPVAKKYSKKYNVKDCKKELELENEKKYVLLINGSMGFGNVMEMLKELLEKVKEVSFIVACGNNKKLFNKLEKEYNNNDRVIILAYTNNLNKYIACSEIVLTKPGGLTTTEIATMRKPFIHTMPIPGCENYNASFFEERKMSIKCNNIKALTNATNKLLYDKELQNEMISNQRKYIKIDACTQIADIIIYNIKEERK